MGDSHQPQEDNLFNKLLDDEQMNLQKIAFNKAFFYYFSNHLLNPTSQRSSISKGASSKPGTFGKADLLLIEEEEMKP